MGIEDQAWDCTEELGLAYRPAAPKRVPKGQGGNGSFWHQVNKRLRLPNKVTAEMAGVTVSSYKKYIYGEQKPRRRTKVRMADRLEKYAVEVLKVADEIRESIG